MSNAAVSRETAAFLRACCKLRERSNRFRRGGHCPSARILRISDFSQKNNLDFALRRQILRSKICGRAMLAPTFRFERSINKRACCSSLCNRLLVYLGLGGHRTGSAGVVLRAANLSSNDCRGQSHLDSGAARPTGGDFHTQSGC